MKQIHHWPNLCLLLLRTLLSGYRLLEFPGSFSNWSEQKMWSQNGVHIITRLIVLTLISFAAKSSAEYFVNCTHNFVKCHKYCPIWIFRHYSLKHSIFQNDLWFHSFINKFFLHLSSRQQWLSPIPSRTSFYLLGNFMESMFVSADNYNFCCKFCQIMCSISTNSTASTRDQNNFSLKKNSSGIS